MTNGQTLGTSSSQANKHGTSQGELHRNQGSLKSNQPSGQTHHFQGGQQENQRGGPGDTDARGGVGYLAREISPEIPRIMHGACNTAIQS